MRLLSISLLLAFLVVAAPAFAAPAIDDAGAAKLKKEVEDAFAFTLKMSENTGEGMKIEGPIQVTPSGAYYQVKVPNVRFDVAEGRLNVGNLVMNASPTDDGAYLVSTAIPTRLAFKAANGSDTAIITIGEQKCASVWYPAYNNITKLDASYKDIAIAIRGATEKDSLDVKVGEAKIVRNLDKNADGTWSGPDSMNLLGLSLSGIGGQKSNIFSIKNVTVNTVTDQLDMAQLVALQTKIQDAIASATTNGMKQSDPAAFKAMVEEMMNDKSVVMNGFSTALEASGISAALTQEPAQTDPTKPAVPKTVSFSVNKVGYGISMKDIKKEKGFFNFKATMDGLAVTDIPAEDAGVIPTSANLDVAFDNLPMQKLAQTFMSLVKTSMDAAVDKAAGQKAQGEVMMMMATLPQILNEAGSTMTVRDTGFIAPDIASNLDGSFSMKQGKMTLSVKGLDELIAKLQGGLSTAKDPAKVGRMVQSLTMAQMSGQNQPGPDGKSNRVYVIELTTDGKMLLNGANMSALTGGMLGGGARPVAPVPPTIPAP